MISQLCHVRKQLPRLRHHASANGNPDTGHQNQSLWPYQNSIRKGVEFSKRLISPRQNRNIIISLCTQPCKVQKICEIFKKKVTAHICKKFKVGPPSHPLPRPPVALLQGSDQRRQLLKRSFLLDELYEGASVQWACRFERDHRREEGPMNIQTLDSSETRGPFQDELPGRICILVTYCNVSVGGWIPPPGRQVFPRIRWLPNRVRTTQMGPTGA